ncbi:MAG: LysR family transcriptional regulator substrate-binding protein [Corynebacterium sp.]|nr:LysR family transcriptional regulator substrate-binding protein [Corynebacterium sp.]
MPILAFSLGTAPAKWLQRYSEFTPHAELQAVPCADPVALLLANDVPAGAVDPAEPRDAVVSETQATLALVRLPDTRIDLARENYHVVDLYEEALGIAVPKEHPLAVFETITPEDLVEEIIHPSSLGVNGWDAEAIREMLSVVAANVGVLIAPLPLLRNLSTKQVVVRPYADPEYYMDPAAARYGRSVEYSASHIALIWEKRRDSAAIQDFVGICKGRRVGSSRQVAGQEKQSPKVAQVAKSQAKRKGSSNESRVDKRDGRQARKSQKSPQRSFKGSGNASGQKRSSHRGKGPSGGRRKRR